MLYDVSMFASMNVRFWHLAFFPKIFGAHARNILAHSCGRCWPCSSWPLGHGFQWRVSFRRQFRLTSTSSQFYTKSLGLRSREIKVGKCPVRVSRIHLRVSSWLRDCWNLDALWRLIREMKSNDITDKSDGGVKLYFYSIPYQEAYAPENQHSTWK